MFTVSAALNQNSNLLRTAKNLKSKDNSIIIGTNICILIYFFIYFSYARFIFKILLNLIFIFLSSDNYKNKKTADCWSWGWSIWRGGLKLYWHFETSRLVVNHRFWIFIWGFGVGSEAHIPIHQILRCFSHSFFFIITSQ